MFQQIGKIMVIGGLAAAAIGAVLYVLGRLGLSRLPGDVSFGGRNWRVYLPIGTCLLLSLIASVILYVLHRLRR